MLSREWRCSWSSADRRCSNYIWVINNFIAYQGASYIRGFTVSTILKRPLVASIFAKTNHGYHYRNCFSAHISMLWWRCTCDAVRSIKRRHCCMCMASVKGCLQLINVLTFTDLMHLYIMYITLIMLIRCHNSDDINTQQHTCKDKCKGHVVVLMNSNSKDLISKHYSVIMGAMASQITSLSRLFRRRSKKTSKLRVTGLCEGNSPVTGQ